MASHKSLVSSAPPLHILVKVKNNMESEKDNVVDKEHNNVVDMGNEKGKDNEIDRKNDGFTVVHTHDDHQ